MALRQRLTFASMWAFEDIGVQEIEAEFKKNIPDPECHFEYSSPEDVLVVKGRLESSTPQVAKVASAFIEGQKNKDLLDMPRVRLLEIPSMLQDNSSVIPERDNDDHRDLLSLDEGPDEEIIPQTVTRIIKFWLSENGDVGCFTYNKFADMLVEIANCTGTEITIVDGSKGIQVSGKRANDVDDAMARISRIEKAMSGLKNPGTAHVLVAPDNIDTRISLQNYGGLNDVSLRRVLTDPSISPDTDVSQMFVTVLHSLDEEQQAFVVPEHLLNPTSSCKEPGKSRIWGDFTFQEIGKGDRFLAMESIVESNPANLPQVAPGISHNHPYLSAEKANQVNRWVAEGAEMSVNEEADLELELEAKASSCNPPKFEASQKLDSVSYPSRRPPGIKARRVIPSVKPTVFDTRKGHMSELGAFKVFEEPKDCVTATRKRWKMNYTADLTNQTTATDTDMASKVLKNDFKLVNTIPEDGKLCLPASFDATKYGPNRVLQGHKMYQNLGSLASQNNGKQTHELIDIMTPVDSAKHNNLTSFMPSLVPKKTYTSCTDQSDENLVLQNHNFQDLVGLKFESSANPYEPYSDESSQETGSFNNSFQVDKGERLSQLKKVYHECLSDSSWASNKPINRSRQMSRTLEAKILGELERSGKTEGKQFIDEIGTRMFHCIMKQKAANPTSKVEAKAETRAKRQATLEDSWGITRKPSKKQPVNVFKFKEASSQSTEPRCAPNKGQESTLEEGTGVNKYIKQTFASIKSTLDAVEAFPGTLILELQLGLVLIPLLPKTYGGGLMPVGEWSKIFQPQTGLAAPSTKFVNRLTTSGADVDYIVDLRTSKAQGKRRIFESEFSEYSVAYEYHCRTKADQILIITIDEQGKYTIQKPIETLGAVNLHFPGHTWDARVAVSGMTEYRFGSNPEFEEAAQYLAENIWVQPDKSLVRLFTCLPKGDKISIDKVLMKRWTRHRHVRYDSPTASAPNEEVIKDQESTYSGIETDAQDIFVQIMEVQELFIGIADSVADQPVRARCAPSLEMIRKGKLWYQVSLVSPAIDTILRANRDLEVGERTEDWKSVDLLGRDASLFYDQVPFSHGPMGPVAAAIGNAGLGDLLRLTKTVVEKIDGVGYWNYGPTADALRMISGESINNVPGVVYDRPIAPSLLEPVLRMDPVGLEFDEIESVKDVESIGDKAADVAQKFEQEYW